MRKYGLRATSGIGSRTLKTACRFTRTSVRDDKSHTHSSVALSTHHFWSFSIGASADWPPCPRSRAPVSPYIVICCWSWASVQLLFRRFRAVFLAQMCVSSAGRYSRRRSPEKGTSAGPSVASGTHTAPMCRKRLHLHGFGCELFVGELGHMSAGCARQGTEDGGKKGGAGQSRKGGGLEFERKSDS